MMFTLQALDTLTFRTANPFDAGVNFHAYSQFPPLPSVYAGALRQDQKIAARKIKIGFNGVLLAGEFAFPQPLDTIITSTIGKKEVTTMKLIDTKTSTHELDKMIAPRQQQPAKVKTSATVYLMKQQLQSYLTGELTNEYVDFNAYYQRESHIGIEMEQDSHSTKSGRWYSTEMIRSVNCSLVAEAEGTPTRVGDVVKLGGNAKLAKVEVTEPF